MNSSSRIKIFWTFLFINIFLLSYAQKIDLVPTIGFAKSTESGAFVERISAMYGGAVQWAPAHWLGLNFIVQGRQYLGLDKAVLNRYSATYLGGGLLSAPIKKLSVTIGTDYLLGFYKVVNAPIYDQSLLLFPSAASLWRKGSLRFWAGYGKKDFRIVLSYITEREDVLETQLDQSCLLLSLEYHWNPWRKDGME